MPTLSFSTAAPSLVPSVPGAGSPAPEGAGDAFAAMLAGLSALPAAHPAQPATAATTAAPDGTALPQVRQDPAAWLPGEEAEAPVEIVSLDPVLTPAAADQPKPKSLRVDLPDCEMPPDLDGPPLLSPVLASLPAPVATPANKGWALRLSSALTPARVAPDLSMGEQLETSEPKTAEPKTAEIKSVDSDSAEQPQMAVSGSPTPSLPAQPVASVAPALPPLTQDGELPQTEGQSPSQGPGSAAPVQLPSVALPPQIAREQARHVAHPAVAADPTAAATPRAALEPNPAALSFTPELSKQIVRAIEAPLSSPEPQPVEIGAAPIQPAPTQPAPTVAVPPPAPAPAPTLAQPAPVDLGRAEWVQAMVDRIAELPQAEGKREAQITLLPAALGKVDVSIVQRDEQMQVTLNAETAQARQLLADAAPRLQEMAEARGLRLAEPQVGGGQPQDRRGAQDQQQPQTPQRPRSASAGTDNDPQPHGDLIA